VRWRVYHQPRPSDCSRTALAVGASHRPITRLPGIAGTVVRAPIVICHCGFTASFCPHCFHIYPRVIVITAPLQPQVQNHPLAGFSWAVVG
jgi:hypothetical protein